MNRVKEKSRVTGNIRRKYTRWFIAAPLAVALSGVSFAGAPVGGLDSAEARVGPGRVDRLSLHLGDIPRQLVQTGVIDLKAFDAVYGRRGGLSETQRQLFRGEVEALTITPGNAGFALNLLWALGLGNQSPVLEQGPMSAPRYQSPARFASTGGWSLAKGKAMDHYGRHAFISLRPQEQRLVEKVSRHVFRPCCNNPTYFPDCNHGMAMLGLLQLLAAQGADEQALYHAAWRINRLWFPAHYKVIENYLSATTEAPYRFDPANAVGRQLASASGYRQLAARYEGRTSNGVSCGI